jgi:uncharacterized protein YcbX
MRIAALGLTTVKGMAHTALPEVELTPTGPRDDRRFCLVDIATGRVLRTAEDDRLMACQSVWTPPVLTIRTPVGQASGVVVDGDRGTADYWGQTVDVVTVHGPWTQLLSRHVGRAVTLCRVLSPGAVVWAGSVSVVATSSLAEVARRLGRRHDDGSRFRPTVIVDTDGSPAFIEDRWVGRRLGLGAATIDVADRLARCAVVDRRPRVGGSDFGVLARLAPDRVVDGEIVFGVTGDVHRPGRVAVGDPVRLEP